MPIYQNGEERARKEEGRREGGREVFPGQVELAAFCVLLVLNYAKRTGI